VNKLKKTDHRITYIIYPANYVAGVNMYKKARCIKEASKHARSLGEGAEVDKYIKNIHNHGSGTFSECVDTFIFTSLRVNKYAKR
jgi:hypothetical protein